MGMVLKGLPTFAPFDKDHHYCSRAGCSPKLLGQLKPGGIMVIPLDEGEQQRIRRITKREDGTLQDEAFTEFSLCRC